MVRTIIRDHKRGELVQVCPDGVKNLLTDSGSLAGNGQEMRGEVVGQTVSGRFAYEVQKRGCIQKSVGSATRLSLGASHQQLS